MSCIIKYAVVIALLLIGVIGGVKLYSAWRAQKPAEVSKAAAGAPAQATLDLNEKQVAAVKIETVGSATFVPQRNAVGNIDFNQNLLVQVFTPYQGRIIEAYPNIGDKVEKDQVLFTIDSPDLLSAELALIAAAGVLKLQNVTLVRAQKMKSFGGASQQAVDQSTSDQMTAEGALKSARDAVRIFGKTDAEIDDIIARRKADPRTHYQEPRRRLRHVAQRRSRSFRSARRGSSFFFEHRRGGAAGDFHHRRSFDDVDVRQCRRERRAAAARRPRGQGACRGLSGSRI